MAPDVPPTCFLLPGAARGPSQGVVSGQDQDLGQVACVFTRVTEKIGRGTDTFRLRKFGTSALPAFGCSEVPKCGRGEGIDMQRVVAFASQKGGIGKTTVAMSFAAVAAESARVLLVDVDEQESATNWASRVPDSAMTFDFAAGTDPSELSRLKDQPYDLVVVDCPGHLDGHGVIPAVLEAADYVVLVTDTKYMSFPPLGRSIANVVGPTGLPYRVLLNLVEMSKGGRAREADAREMLNQNGIPTFESFIRSYVVHENAPLRGQLVTTYPRTKATFNAIEDVRKFHSELLSEWSFSPDQPAPAEIRLTDPVQALA